MPLYFLYFSGRAPFPRGVLPFLPWGWTCRAFFLSHFPLLSIAGRVADSRRVSRRFTCVGFLGLALGLYHICREGVFTTLGRAFNWSFSHQSRTFRLYSCCLRYSGPLYKFSFLRSCFVDGHKREHCFGGWRCLVALHSRRVGGPRMSLALIRRVVSSRPSRPATGDGDAATSGAGWVGLG